MANLMNVCRRKLCLTREVLAGVIRLKLARWSNYHIMPHPLILVWEATNQCNCKCVYCDTWKNPRQDEILLTFDEIKTIIQAAADMGLCGMVFTGGGEPLLRGDVFEVIKFAKNLGLWVALTTNGTLINAENVHKVLQAELVTLSIDTMDRDEYELRRGRHGYKNVMEAVELLRTCNKNTYLTVQTVIDESNWRKINDINEYFYFKGFDTVFQLIYNKYFNIDSEAWKRQINKLKYHRAFTATLHNIFLKKFPEIAAGKAAVPCFAGSANIVISPAGKLMACNTFGEPGIDLRKTPFTIAWKSMTAIRKYIDSPERRCICGNTCYIPLAIFLA
jgi:AdoMet-dependent heme synthase